jgi:hypothetical protein
MADTCASTVATTPVGLGIVSGWQAARNRPASRTNNPRSVFWLIFDVYRGMDYSRDGCRQK